MSDAYTDNVVNIANKDGAYTMTCRKFDSFSALWEAYSNVLSDGQGDWQGVTKVQAQGRLATTGVWGFVTPEDSTIWFFVAADGEAEYGAVFPNVVAFFAHEVDHLLRAADTAEQSEASAVVTADCARIATHMAISNVLAGGSSERQ